MQHASNTDSDSRPAGLSGEQASEAMLHLDDDQQLQYGAPQQMQYQQTSQPAQFIELQQQLGSAGTPAIGLQLTSGPWVKYYIQRVSTNVSHVLFYVVDPEGMAKLAVVGTDVKLSGHFVYASVSDMTDASSLRCTNRQKVLEWLADLGAVELAEDHEVSLPQLAPHHWQQLHSNNPMMMKPALDRNYTSWREDSGILSDGRHYKHFMLVDAATGHERLAVVGEDSARQDRRYTYKALEDVGGLCFENGKAVQDWLDFVVGHSVVPPGALRRDRPPERSRRAAGKKRRAAGATTEEELQDLAAYNMSTGGRMSSLPPQLPPGGRYGPGSLAPPSHMPSSAPGNVFSAPRHTPPLPFDQRYLAPAATQPGIGSQYAPGFLQQPQGSGPGPAGFGAPARTEPVDMDAAVRAAGEEVRQLFAVGGQPLLTFVTHVPNAESIDFVSEMARRLNSFVDALGLTGSPGSSAVNAQEVMDILRFLADRPASLKLLESTGIGRPVALLGCMHDVLAAQGQQLRPEAAQELQPVYETSRQLASVWQDLAATAHQLANEALEAGGGPL